MTKDQGSISGQNLTYIAVNSGFDRNSILTFCPRTVSNDIRYAPVPEDCAEKVTFLKELLQIRDGDLDVCFDEGKDFLTKEELQDLIFLVSTEPI